MNNKKSLFAAAVAAACAFSAAPAFADDDARTIAVFGDWPYGQDLLDNAHGLINAINADRDVKLVMHVGDIHSGSMPCTGAGYAIDYVSKTGSALASSNPGWNQHVFARFQQFDKPLIYTPGDNEWADCHKSKQLSSGAPLAELASVRELFFAKPGKSLGKTEKRVISQAEAFDDAHPSDSQFVENVMWEDEGVVFATFNIPGGSNDDADLWTGAFKNDAAQAQERADREGANARWLDAAFDFAARRHARAVVLGLQANMWDSEKVDGINPAKTNLDNYTPFVQKLATRSLAFARPVMLLNGDSHKYKADRPLVPSTGVPVTLNCENTPAGCDLSLIHKTPVVPNLRRIIVQGSGEPTHSWVKLKIDTESKEVFSWVTVAY